MSQIQVDNIYNKEGDGAPSLPLGANVTGVVTATSFVGSGAGITGVTATAVGTLSSLNVTGNVSIGGTLTYEDVTNIDSVGIITARDGVVVVGNGVSIAAGGLDVTAGVSTFTDIKIAEKITHVGDENTDISFGTDSINLRVGGNSKLNTSTAGVLVYGTILRPNDDNQVYLGTGVGPQARWAQVHAVEYYGGGSNLTGIAVTEAPVTDYTVTANGASAYRFHGGGVDETADDPDLYLIRGQKYRFNNTTGSSHPFALRVSSGGSAYTDGVTGSQNGIQFFTVPYSAPASLVYQCTVHSGMVGNIYISGGQYNTQQNNPVFIAYRVSNYNLTTTESALVYDSEKIDVGGNYNTSNGRFTAPVTGLYEFGYTSIASNVSTTYRYTLKVNGSDPYSPLRMEFRIDKTDNSTSNEFGTNGEFVAYVNMTAGQYAQIYAKSDTGVSNVYGDTGYGYTYFRGRLIG